MGSNYANLFVGYVEEQIFNQFDGPKPELFGRYIDDCLGATSCTKEELERCIGFVNSFHPALKFTWEISEASVNFLDINISVQDNKLGHSHEHMEICGIYLHLGNNETRKRKEQRLVFKLGTLAPKGINERFSFA